MTGPSIPGLPDGAEIIRAAISYAEAGWYVLAVEPDTKRPAKFYRREWQQQSSRDPKVIADWFIGSNYLIGLHVGRSGAIVFDVDSPEYLPEPLKRAVEETNPPFQSTRDNNPGQGHYAFLVPGGKIFGNSRGNLVKAGENKFGEVRGLNGIIVVEPSEHTKEHGRYKWLTIGPLPILPDYVTELLPDANLDEIGASAVSNETIQQFFRENNNNKRPNAAIAILRGFEKEASVVGSRHDALVRHLVWGLREARMGLFPAEFITNELRKRFKLLTAGDRYQFGEFEGILGWAVAQALLIDPEQRAAEVNARLDSTSVFKKPSERKFVKDEPKEEDSDDPDESGEDEDEVEQIDVRSDMRSGFRNKDGKVRININDRAAAAEFLKEEVGRGGLSGIYRRGAHAVHTPRVGENGYIPPKDDLADDGPAQVHAISQNGLLTLIESRYDVGKSEKSSKDSDKWQWRRALLPQAIVNRVLGAVEIDEAPNVRELKAVTHTPMIRKDGTILDKPGFDESTGVLYLPTAGLTGIRVPENPTAEDIKWARETILYPIEEFPWVSIDDQANWIGCAFTPLLRTIVPPPYQFGVIEAPSPGSGKGYLLGVLREVHGAAMRPGMPNRDEEWSKVITTMLVSTTAPIVAFDNVRGVVHSSVLEGLLTSAQIADRTLGKNDEAMHLSNDRLWMMTGNNAQIGGDLARRTLRMTIDPRQPNPETRTGFKCQPVHWTRENRADYIRALLLLSRAWIVAGSPKEPIQRSDDYADWIQTVRGIMTYAGFPGTFAASERKERSTEDEEWNTFLEAIADVLGEGATFTAKEIYQVIDTPGPNPTNAKRINPLHLPGELADRFGDIGRETRFMKSLGLWMKNRAGRYAGDLKIVDVGKGTSGQRKNVQVYKLERAGEAPALMPDPSEPTSSFIYG